MSDSAVVGTFPGQDITRGTWLLGTNRYSAYNNTCTCILIHVYVSWLKCTLWGCSSTRLVVMCCKYMCAGLSANSHEMLPKTYEV